jgi:hypothetical protein
MPDTATYTNLYSYVQAWAEAARLQSRGYVTQVTRADGGRGYVVSYMTHEEYFEMMRGREATQDDRSK